LRLLLAGHDAEPEPETVALGGRVVMPIGDLVARHLIDRLRLEQALAVQLAAVEQHLQEAPVIMGGGSKSCPAGVIMIVVRDGVRGGIDKGPSLDFPIADAADGFFVVHCVQSGQPRALLLGHKETGVVHLERLENPLAEEFIERLAGDDFDDSAKHIGIEAVTPVSPIDPSVSTTPSDTPASAYSLARCGWPKRR